MSKSFLLLALTIPVFAEGDDSLDTNNSKTNYELLVFGKSKHFIERENGEAFNEVNPGIGFTKLNQKWDDHHFVTSQTAVIYKNSYFMWTGIVGYGINAKFGDDNGFHTIMGLTGGLMMNSEYIVPTAIPNIGVGYKNVSAYVAIIGWGAFGFFASYRF